MPTITLQLGQCGNQVRPSLSLAPEEHPLELLLVFALPTRPHPPRHRSPKACPAAATRGVSASACGCPGGVVWCAACPQLGSSLFHTMASEFSSADYGAVGVEEFFRPVDVGPGAQQQQRPYVARSLLIDMEPKVCMGEMQGEG